MSTNGLSAVTLILSDARGIYIPRDFVRNDFGDIAWEHCEKWGLTRDNADQWKAAAYPDHDFYWEAWQWILDFARYTDEDGNDYHLYQDGSLWGLCYERMTDEEKENFGIDID